MRTMFARLVKLQFGLRQKIILILVGLTTTIVLLLGLATYSTIQRMSTNFQRSFDLEVPLSRVLIVLKDEVITRRDYLETFLLSSDPEDLGIVVGKYGELSQRIDKYLRNPTALLQHPDPLEKQAGQPSSQFLTRRPYSSSRLLDHNSQVRDILGRAHGVNAEFDQKARQLMQNHLLLILLTKNARLIQNNIRPFFTADLKRIPAMDAGSQQVLSEVALLRGLEAFTEIWEPSYVEDIQGAISQAAGAVQQSSLTPENKERILQFLPQYRESLLFLLYLQKALAERRSRQVDLFKAVKTIGNTLTELVNQADAIATGAVLASLDDNVEAQRRSLALIVFTWVGSLGLSIIMSVYVIRRITQPLVQLSDGARSMAEGVFEGEVKVEGKDEIALLAKTFNQMTRRIKEQITALKQADSMLISQERLAAIGQLAAGIAHEIRNPLSAIKMNVQILARKSDTGGADREYWDILIKEVNRLDRIVNDTLEYTQPPALSKTWCDLHGILEECKAIIRQGEEIAFVERYDWDIPRLFVDEGRIRQVILNLLINACQSMGRVKRIGITTGQAKQDGRGCVLVSISDVGTGIRPEDLERIYDPFFSTKVKGIGLGLSISKRIVELHGGRIEVASVGSLEGGPPEGEGWSTEFTVFLPAEQEG